MLIRQFVVFVFINVVVGINDVFNQVNFFGNIIDIVIKSYEGFQVIKCENVIFVVVIKVVFIGCCVQMIVV